MINKSGPLTEVSTESRAKPDLYAYYRNHTGKSVVCVFFENKNVKICIQKCCGLYRDSGNATPGGKNWVRIMRQACKYVHTQKTRRFVLCDYINWGFVEIDSVDTDADVFDCRIYWKQWDDSEPQLTVRWRLAAFMMFDSDASNSDASNGEQVRSEKIVADMKEIFKRSRC